MLRGRTLLLLWLILPISWLGGGALAFAKGISVHGPGAAVWMLAGVLGAVALVGATLWALTGRRTPDEDPRAG